MVKNILQKGKDSVLLLERLGIYSNSKSRTLWLDTKMSFIQATIHILYIADVRLMHWDGRFLGVFMQSPVVSRITHCVFSELFSGNSEYDWRLLLRCLVYIYTHYYTLIYTFIQSIHYTITYYIHYYIYLYVYLFYFYIYICI